MNVHGVVSTDRSNALVAVSRLASGPSHHTAAVRVPMLDDHTRYCVSVIGDLAEPLGGARRQPDWVESTLVATGRQLATIGVRAPQLHSESTLLIHVEALHARDALSER